MAQAIKKIITATASAAISLAVLTLFQASTLSVALAQQVPAQKWFKVCAKQADNDVCNVQYQVVASTGQVITSVNLLSIKGKINQKIFQITVPTSRLIPAGVAVKVDKNKEKRIPYKYCVPNRCIADIKMDDTLIKLLKSGGEMVLTSVNVQNKPNPIKISLKGFTAAFDGPSMKKSEVDAQNSQLQKQLEEKAKKARKALEEAQKKATE